ncbi:MAG: PIN domain-containing protein [Actinomycetota bacterium]
MTARVFVDTNVLVYARDSSDKSKNRRARDWLEILWRERSGRLSSQVLHEYYTTVTRKLNPGLTVEDARDDIRDLESWKPITITAHVLESAWLIEDRFRLSFWDSLIVAAANSMECKYLLSEDLQHSQDLDGVTVINPFQVEPEFIND